MGKKMKCVTEKKYIPFNKNELLEFLVGETIIKAHVEGDIFYLTLNSGYMLEIAANSEFTNCGEYDYTSLDIAMYFDGYIILQI
ncbi:hypothetical protein LCGC14_1938220 [marine sediment metagenome]|uniref:Uncharacterized protein n=1 Tax=marine sediment metagenome TaxID=412755 RepID=A0A0F9IIF7_9ZZZZ